MSEHDSCTLNFQLEHILELNTQDGFFQQVMNLLVLGLS